MGIGTSDLHELILCVSEGLLSELLCVDILGISFLVAVRMHLIDSLIAWGYQRGDFVPLDSPGLPECILFAL